MEREPTPPEIVRVIVFGPDGEIEREPTLEDILHMAPVIAADWR